VLLPEKPIDAKKTTSKSEGEGGAMKQTFCGDYPDNWPEIALQVKEKAGWKCIRCGHIHETGTGYVLTVHHLDGDRSHSDPEEYWWNLLALCQKCHLSIQGRLILIREWLFPHSAWFQPYYDGYVKWASCKADKPDYSHTSLGAGPDEVTG
jgi:hypothetical protein